MSSPSPPGAPAPVPAAAPLELWEILSGVVLLSASLGVIILRVHPDLPIDVGYGDWLRLIPLYIPFALAPLVLSDFRRQERFRFRVRDRVALLLAAFPGAAFTIGQALGRNLGGFEIFLTGSLAAMLVASVFAIVTVRSRRAPARPGWSWVVVLVPVTFIVTFVANLVF